MQSKRPKYVVEFNTGEKEFYKTKKAICEKFGFKLSSVNRVINSMFSLRVLFDGRAIWIKQFTCENCKDYMIESKNCINCK